MPIVKLSSKGQVVIPAQLRKKLGLKPGAQIQVFPNGDKGLTVEPVPDDPIEAACGMFNDPEFSYTEALLKERREERAREERKFARFFRPARISKSRTRLRKGPRPS